MQQHLISPPKRMFTKARIQYGKLQLKKSASHLEKGVRRFAKDRPAFTILMAVTSGFVLLAALIRRARS